eukprot:TRINITY_DN21414_c0_g1_i1.p1 TRINITY_DN21414_c0_g1~~TRINITY_DN21414_c0_g1_i1.p1  ORF type:complete len:303 (+),score=69.25 TRINITY_DN21414_c0_g1_i1:112-909(+)
MLRSLVGSEMCIRDRFGVAFVANLVLIVSVAVCSNRAGAWPIDLETVVNVLVFSMPVSLGCSAMLLWTVRWNPYFLIQASLILPAASAGTMALVSLFAGSVWSCIVFATAALGSTCWFFAVQRRVPVAASMLEIAAKVNAIWPATVCSLSVLVLGLMYIAAWSLAANSILQYLWSLHDLQYIPQLRVAGIGYVLVSLFWTVQVGQNIVYVVAAGVVGTWWSRGGAEATGGDPNPAPRLFQTGLTSSLGSICLGSDRGSVKGEGEG